MTKALTHNLHVPLSDPTYRSLRIEAQRSNRPATDIAREAIDQWLAEQHRITIHESVAAYALEVGGTSADLDVELEAAGIESLLTVETSVAGRRH